MIILVIIFVYHSRFKTFAMFIDYFKTLLWSIFLLKSIYILIFFVFLFFRFSKKTSLIFVFFFFMKIYTISFGNLFVQYYPEFGFTQRCKVNKKANEFSLCGNKIIYHLRYNGTTSHWCQARVCVFYIWKSVYASFKMLSSS